jgi:hypothetical protein
MWRRLFKISLAMGWALWLACMAWLAVGMQRYLQSVDATLAPIILTPGQTSHAEVYRLREAPLWMEARFGGPMDRARPELGEYTTRIGAPGFIDPGEPVRIRVRDDNGLDIMVAAAPRSGTSATHFYRKLWPESYLDGAQLETAPSFPKLAKGTSRLTFTVEEVGPKLQGEQIELEVSSPIGLKRVAPGWEDVSTFIFWPFLAAILGVWALVWGALTWWYRRHGRRHPAACRP